MAHNAQPNPAKRARNDRGVSAYPRKRATTACQLCRSRKIKCSNDRPTCVSCGKLGLTCVYDDSNVDHSSFDPASQLIIEKLNQVLERLPNEPGSAPPTQVFHSPMNDASASQGPSRQSHGAPEEDDDHIARDALRVPSAYASVEQMFTWPIFDDSDAAQKVANTIIASQSVGADESDQVRHPATKESSLQDVSSSQSLVQLVEKFISSVHSKVPFLDPADLRRAAARGEELGPAWDCTSCLVLLACAVGSITRPFDPTPLPTNEDEAAALGPDKVDWATAEVFYDSACRRFGSLATNVEAAQCHVLSGIYLMYKLRPLQAGYEFQLASTTYLRHRGGLEAILRLKKDPAKYPAYTPSEQRIFWTCLQLESQIIAEIDGPKSGIADLKCKDLFPSPPLPAAARENGGPFATLPTPPLSEVSSAAPEPLPELDADETATWYYYITEISLRRLINRMLNTFYVCDYKSWNPHTAAWMLDQVGEFEEQLAVWLRSLPEPLRFLDDSAALISQDERRFALRQRYVHICTLLYRPFLYLAITHWDQLSNNADKILSLASKAIESCFIMNDGIGLRHRYEGTWYACRLCAVQIRTLFAAKSAGLLMHPRFVGSGYTPRDVEQSFKVNKAALVYWAQESPDLAALRDVADSFTLEVTIGKSYM